jgi:hypothetical protein
MSAAPGGGNKLWPLVALCIALGYVLQVIASVIGTILPWVAVFSVLVVAAIMAVRRSWPW